MRIPSNFSKILFLCKQNRKKAKKKYWENGHSSIRLSVGKGGVKCLNSSNYSFKMSVTNSLYLECKECFFNSLGKN